MDKINFPSVEEHLNGLKGFDMHAIQLSSGKFLCQQRDLQLPKLILGIALLILLCNIIEFYNMVVFIY